MHSFVTSKNAQWPRLIWPTLYSEGEPMTSHAIGQPADAACATASGGRTSWSPSSEILHWTLSLLHICGWKAE